MKYKIGDVVRFTKRSITDFNVTEHGGIETISQENEYIGIIISFKNVNNLQYTYGVAHGPNVIEIEEKEITAIYVAKVEDPDPLGLTM